MNQSDKRRGGAAGPGPSTGHVHRAGPHPSQLGNRQSPNQSKHKDQDQDREPDSSTGPATMPTLPPRAAVNSASATSNPEETYDANSGTGGSSVTTATGAAVSSSNGGQPSTDRAEKERDHDGYSHARDGKDKDKDNAGGSGSGTQRTNSIRNASSSSGGWGSSKAKHRDLAAVTTQLHERERRIAHLEREMAIMEREFQQQLDKLSQNESETTTFWQTKYSQLNQQFLRTDTELRLLRNEVEAREDEREELRQGWEVLRRELKERDDDIRGLRSQVRGLKEFVSTSTRTDGQTSDEVFGDGMTRLGNGLQNWVIVNFRKAKMGKSQTSYCEEIQYQLTRHILDLSKVDEPTLAELNELVPMYEELALTSKVHLLQSIVSAVLVEMVFNSYYVGLSDESMSHFRQMEKLLLSFSTFNSTLAPYL